MRFQENMFEENSALLKEMTARKGDSNSIPGRK